MAAVITEFKIDYTIYLQRADLSKSHKCIQSNNSKCTHGSGISTTKTRYFIVKTFNEADALKLENASITFWSLDF